MSEQLIFEVRDSSGVVHWSISRDGENFRTIGAGHFMCVGMAKEIERLRTALAEAERDAARLKTSFERLRTMLGQWFTSPAMDEVEAGTYPGVRYE